MTSPQDPLPLPCGQVLPNRLVKAAMSEALSDSAHSPDDRLADGIARRSPRVMAPARWQPISAMRGLIALALDPRLARNPRTQAALAALDARTTTP